MPEGLSSDTEEEYVYLPARYDYEDNGNFLYSERFSEEKSQSVLNKIWSGADAYGIRALSGGDYNVSQVFTGTRYIDNSWMIGAYRNAK